MHNTYVSGTLHSTLRLKFSGCKNKEAYKSLRGIFFFFKCLLVHKTETDLRLVFLGIAVDWLVWTPQLAQRRMLLSDKLKES